MYTIKLKRSTHSMTVKHVTRNVSLKHVGRRGPKGDTGEVPEGVVTTVNDQIAVNGNVTLTSDEIPNSSIIPGESTTAAMEELQYQITAAELLISEKVNTSDLAEVATSGDYNDLINAPTIPDVPVTSVNGRTGDVVGLAENADLVAHTSDTANPHAVTKAQVGLGSAENTSDADKPVSTAQAAAIALRELAVTPGTNLQYYRGDKSWQTLNTSVVTEGTNLYYTNARADARIAADTTHLLLTGGTVTGNILMTNAYLQAGTTTDVIGNALAVMRNGIQVGRIDNNSNGLRIQAQTGTLQLRGTGNNGISVDSSGNATFASNIITPSTSTGVLLYNTIDQTTDFEMGSIGWVSNRLKIQTKSGGTATDRQILLEAADKGTGVAQFFVDRSASPFLHATHSSTSAARTALQISGTSTASSSAYTSVAIIPTINQTSTGSYTALLVNPTESATGSGTKLLADFQVGGVSKAKIDNGGFITTPRLLLNSTAYFDGAVAGTTNMGAGNLGVLATGGSATHSLTLGSTATGMAFYNTSDQTTNYERYRAFWQSNVFNIVGEFGGTGTSRSIKVSPFGAAATGFLQVNASSVNGFVQSAGASATASAVIHAVNGTLSASSGTQYGLSLSPTLNQTSTASYTALLVNPTETGTGSGTKMLADFQVGGSSKFSVSNTGKLNIASSTAPASPANGDIWFDGTDIKMRVGGVTKTFTLV